MAWQSGIDHLGLNVRKLNQCKTSRRLPRVSVFKIEATLGRIPVTHESFRP